MPLSDYAHWNEDAQRIWWAEEGRHADSDAEASRQDEYDAEDAFAAELGEMSDDELHELLADEMYLERWPKAKPLIEFEIRARAEIG